LKNLIAAYLLSFLIYIYGLYKLMPKKEKKEEDKEEDSKKK